MNAMDYMKPKTYTDDELSKMETTILAMSRYDMAALWRFAPSGHPYFRTDLPLVTVFERRFFKDLGGFSPEISRALG